VRIEGSFNGAVLILYVAASVFVVAVIAAGWTRVVPLHHKPAYAAWVDYGRR
jgi:hypothetical protein